MHASGRQYELEHGAYRAAVASVGASLRGLTHRGRDLVRSFGADEVRPRFRGAVLAPWPNRVPDGRWTWRGQTHQLALTEPEHASALHGLVCWLDWHEVEVGSDTVVLGTRVWPQQGYPFALDLTMRWRLGADGLDAELSAVNVGGEPAPYGCSIHPYLTAPAGGYVDDWTLHLPAARRLEVDDRLRVVGTAEQPPPHADFNRARPVRGTAIDHAYTGLAFDSTDTAAVTVTDPAGDGVQMTFGPRTPWVQVHTADRPDEPGHHRRGLAVEPMTCPPEALATGLDLIVLDPGESVSVPWRIAAV
ncbi:aldose 1-epimerase family protein [uncultured Jatrophihabitans sp.]|uniref:aldose 1-epimerase family protein n=1 Tax=uncultured Jatrophihabitans sp. TaxID=1610747 RepID=UPI0035CB92DC